MRRWCGSPMRVRLGPGRLVLNDGLPTVRLTPGDILGLPWTLLTRNQANVDMSGMQTALKEAANDAGGDLSRDPGPHGGTASTRAT